MLLQTRAPQPLVVPALVGPRNGGNPRYKNVKPFFLPPPGAKLPRSPCFNLSWAVFSRIVGCLYDKDWHCFVTKNVHNRLSALVRSAGKLFSDCTIMKAIMLGKAQLRSQILTLLTVALTFLAG